jgi:nickel-dependent lactate racemase
MFILVATGIHRPPTSSEIEQILGTEVSHDFSGRIFVHDPDDSANLAPVGATKRGHVVRINRRAIEADRLIPVGTASYHYHAGFGGGRKSLVPGLAARETIAYNHSLTLDPKQNWIHPGVNLGALDGNPVAEEMLEGAYMCEPDIIVNTVLTPDGKLAGVFSGELDAAHRAACRLVEKICRVDIKKQADFVIASAGKAPNWIQSHKALYHASRAIRDGGRIVLAAPCPEGIGNDRFRYWIKKASLEEIFDGLRQSAEVNGQTALSTKIRGASTILITQLSQADIRDLGIETAPDEESAIRRVLERFAREGQPRPTYYLMPQAGQIAPFIAGC